MRSVNLSVIAIPLIFDFSKMNKLRTIERLMHLECYAYQRWLLGFWYYKNRKIAEQLKEVCAVLRLYSLRKKWQKFIYRADREYRFYCWEAQKQREERKKAKTKKKS